MATKSDVIIYMRYISLDVVIPKDHVWEFMREFGETFAIEDIEGGKRIKTVDNYYDHPGGWHIQVSIFENTETRFYEFLRNFCLKRNLSFREH